MRLTELRLNLAEAWGGSHGFPGNGKNLFKSSHYIYIANQLHDISDQHAKEYLTNWFSETFLKDNPAFKPHQFQAAVDKGHLRAAPSMRFQQRHFYFLAQYVKAVTDPHVREFLTDWLGEMFANKNGDFRIQRWRKFCGMELTPDEESDVDAPRHRRY